MSGNEPEVTRKMGILRDSSRVLGIAAITTASSEGKAQGGDVVTTPKGISWT
ncbi:MAG: hypothetical protein IRZ07_09095 [Microbispora sp.]|nr:hypothetical protein [Microbispora sp.]